MLVRPAALALATTVATSTSSLAQLVTQMPLPVMALRSVALGPGRRVFGSCASATAGLPSGFGVQLEGCLAGTGQPAWGGVGAAARAGSAPGLTILAFFGDGFGLGATGPMDDGDGLGCGG